MNDIARMVRRLALGESKSLGVNDVQVHRLISQRPETTTVLIRLLTHGRLFRGWDVATRYTDPPAPRRMRRGAKYDVSR